MIDPAQRRFRYGVQVNSLGLTEAQPENNVQRIVLEALAVTLGRNARGEERSRNRIRPASDGHRIIGYPDDHMASNNVLNLAPSKRAWTVSPTIADGPTAHNPRQ